MLDSIFVYDIITNKDSFNKAAVVTAYAYSCIFVMCIKIISTVWIFVITFLNKSFITKLMYTSLVNFYKGSVGAT